MANQRSFNSLRHLLWNLDGRPYPAYRSIRGDYADSETTLKVDHVQGDPFAAPSRVRYRLKHGLVLNDDPETRRACADFVHRVLETRLRSRHRGPGSGRSGVVNIPIPGQEILERSAVTVDGSGYVEIRLQVGLPASGRRALGNRAAEIVCDELPDLLKQLLEHLDRQALTAHIQCLEDSVHLRNQLEELELVAFVADGSSLARRSGNDARRLDHGQAFRSPDSLAVDLESRHRGKIRGMGIPVGVTLIVGGGYHGKSTLLRALALGVYDHVPGDGREAVVTRPDVMKVRAEDGRSVRGVDVSAFIGSLPGGQPTNTFSSDEASGSTSQAAAIIEAIELGAKAILLDEDTSATNLLIRDDRMRQLIPTASEPLIPLRERIAWMRHHHGCSLLMVMGGSGDYFDIADTVIAMEHYQARDRGAEARAIAARLPTDDRTARQSPTPLRRRVIEGLEFSAGSRAKRVRLDAVDRVSVDDRRIDLGGLEQLVEENQTRCVAQLVAAYHQRMADKDIATAVAELEAHLASGMHRATDHGDWSRPRRLEIGAVLNRMRALRITTAKPDAAS
ncbi:MAG: ABC-ATPase domain-containing protein [Myxococcota bacterium]